MKKIRKRYEITDKNEWEGETFGFIVRLTTEQVEKIRKRFQEINEAEGSELVSIKPHTLTAKEIALINTYSDNTYLDRLSHRKLSSTVDLDNFTYEEFPYKGNGLERIP